MPDKAHPARVSNSVHVSTVTTQGLFQGFFLGPFFAKKIEYR